MKKLITLLMAVSMVLTSCGKLTGLLNSNKKAENNSFADTKKSLATKEKKSCLSATKEYLNTATNFVYDHKYVAIVVLLIAGFVVVYNCREWIYDRLYIKKITTTHCTHPEVVPICVKLFAPMPNEQLVKIRDNIGKSYFDYEQEAARIVLNDRKVVPLVIPQDVDLSLLIKYSPYPCENLLGCISTSSNSEQKKKKVIAIKFIFDCRNELFPTDLENSL
ncbi:MAG: hypothetical protein LBN01_01210 [Endomicrobium sp.]|jgi:ElaB/YqjD/DUF883 family membrane-anchored ribosome-binding protein|nr:hypothetical protein [Endomicrobium sp.]